MADTEFPAESSEVEDMTRAPWITTVVLALLLVGCSSVGGDASREPADRTTVPATSSAARSTTDPMPAADTSADVEPSAAAFSSSSPGTGAGTELESLVSGVDYKSSLKVAEICAPLEVLANDAQIAEQALLVPSAAEMHAYYLDRYTSRAEMLRLRFDNLGELDPPTDPAVAAGVVYYVETGTALVDRLDLALATFATVAATDADTVVAAAATATAPLDDIPVLLDGTFEAMSFTSEQLDEVYRTATCTRAQEIAEQFR